MTAKYSCGQHSIRLTCVSSEDEHLLFSFADVRGRHTNRNHNDDTSIDDLIASVEWEATL